jgi:hypothetical protein
MGFGAMNKSIRTGIAVSALAVTMAAGVFVGEALARQRHMDAALDALQNARSELQAAEENKGGHRAEALRLTNLAIDEVHRGIDYAD